MLRRSRFSVAAEEHAFVDMLSADDFMPPPAAARRRRVSFTRGAGQQSAVVQH